MGSVYTKLREWNPLSGSKPADYGGSWTLIHGSTPGELTLQSILNRSHILLFEYALNLVRVF
jgi:hypothetical protein